MTQNKKKLFGSQVVEQELVKNLKNFSDRNFRVIVSGRRLKKLKDVQKYNKTNIIPISLDVSDHKNVKKFQT